jgi:hypothetical protein
MLPSLLAFVVAGQWRELPRRGARLIGSAAVSVACLFVFALELPSE